MTYALRIFFIIWYNYKQITIPPPGFGLLDTSGKRHLGDTIFGGTDMRISRQNKILELIETYEIETQDKLASLLREFGYEVTAGHYFKRYQRAASDQDPVFNREV